jgi:hypothetical protein
MIIIMMIIIVINLEISTKGRLYFSDFELHDDFSKVFLKFDAINCGTSVEKYPRIAEWCLLGCYAVWLLKAPTFRRNLAPPSSG